MHDVAIVGAGDLGGALAHVLARHDIAARVRLVDPTGQTAAGKALDIMQAAPVEGFSTPVSGSTEINSVAGSMVIVLADRAGGAEWQADDGVLLLKQLAHMASGSVIVCAGAAQRDLVERAVRELRFPRARIVGSAPEGLASAVRAVVALETNGSAKDVALTVLGVPPGHVVVAWEEAAIGGFAATRVLDEPARRRLAARVAPLWPPGPYALATAAAQAVACVLGRSRRMLACFVAPDDTIGRRARAVALPVRLGYEGVTSVALPVLSVSEQIALDNAMLL